VELFACLVQCVSLADFYVKQKSKVIFQFYVVVLNIIYLLCMILTGTSTSDSIAPDLYEIAEQTYTPELEGLRRWRVKRPLELCSDPYGNG